MGRIIVALVFVAASFSTFPSISSEDSTRVCKSDACKNKAERIVKYMDTDVKPCDDFYRFTCGKLLSSELPKGKSSVSAFSQVQEVVNGQLRGILEEPVRPEEHVAYKAAKRLYALCLKEKKSSRNVKLAKRLLGEAGWPVLGEWWEEQWTLHDQEAKLRNLTLSGGGLFHVDLRPDPQNPGRAQITVDQPLLDRQFLPSWQSQEEFMDTLKLPHVRTYEDYMVDIAVMFGADRQTAETQLRDSLLFELDLEQIVDMPRGRHRPYELMTVAELQGRAGWVNWPALLAAAVVPESLSLVTNELVKVYDPDYLDRLRRLIQQYPKRSIANFMGWRAAERLSLMLTPGMTTRRRQFDNAVGLEVKEPWELCVRLVCNSGLDLAVSAMYVQKFMAEDKRAVLGEMTSNLRDQMYAIIKSEDWIDVKTKQRALLKLCRMREYIGYPNELTKNKKIDEFYQGLNLNLLTDFLEAQILLGKWLSEVGHRRMMKYHWIMHGSVAILVNAMYNSEINLLQLTAAIMHPPFFNASLPKYLYYSTIGVVAGHEITHGFDNGGIHYDADGEPILWWDDSSKMNFDEKGECILNQYSEYIDKCNTTEAGGPIPYLAGNGSLQEIIADNGGLKLAYNAYKKLSAELMYEPEPLLPNLEHFTRDQMFFISLGNVWCFLEDVKKLRTSTAHDVHPPAEFRVNGVLQNFPQFSEAFDCKAGTNMNPKIKCSVW